MFTVLGAIAVIGGAIPLIKKSSEGQDEKKKPAQLQVDPITAVLQAAKTLSQSLPSPLSGHALSKATNPPSFLVPSHTPSPPLSDLQILAGVLAAARKHGLNKWGCQSIFVEENGLDVGVWVGPIDIPDGLNADANKWKRHVASTVVDKLTEGKSDKENISQSLSIISIPESTESDSAFTKAISLLEMHTVFLLPEKEGKQAFFLVGRNSQTNNWLAITAASGNSPQSSPPSPDNNNALPPPTKSNVALSPGGQAEPSNSDTVTENDTSHNDLTETAVESSPEATKHKEGVKAQKIGDKSERISRRKGRKRRRRQKDPDPPHEGTPSEETASSKLESEITKHGPITDTYEQGNKELKGRYDLDVKPANEWIEPSETRGKVTREIHRGRGRRGRGFNRKDPSS